MKISEHLKKLHVAMGQHHVSMAKVHKTAMSKAANMESDDGMSEFHKSAMDAHTEAAEYHAECAKDLSASMKAAGMDDLDALEPLPQGLSRIASDVPSNLRAIPRFGSPEIAKADVPREFAKLVSVEDEPQ